MGAPPDDGVSDHTVHDGASARRYTRISMARIGRRCEGRIDSLNRVKTFAANRKKAPCTRGRDAPPFEPSKAQETQSRDH